MFEDGLAELHTHLGASVASDILWSPALEYPQVRAGLILMMDRTFGERENAIIVDKAIRYASRGIVGVDIAGPRPGGERYPYRELAPLVEEARNAGLGVTIHVGEEGEKHAAAEVGEVIETL